MKDLRRILVYRLGSLGDTIVALPALHLIARAYPDAERWMLTNFNINEKAAPVAQVLNGTGLIHNYIEYPIGTRNLRTLIKLREKIRQLRPDVLLYLTESRSLLKTLRDALFFRWCGLRRLIGVPYIADLRTCQRSEDGMYEYEGARLTRCIRELGDAQLDNMDSFNLVLSTDERQAAQAALAPLSSRPLLAVSIGAKVDVKDWGDQNWSVLISRLSETFPVCGLVMVGAGVERDRSEMLAKNWNGAFINLCGKLTVRESAAVLEHCHLFVGHDSGPMHLAAAVGTPCVGIFSSRSLPGVWFPYGKQHRVIYHHIECQGCVLNDCMIRHKSCINSITVDEVLRQVLEQAMDRFSVSAGKTATDSLVVG